MSIATSTYSNLCMFPQSFFKVLTPQQPSHQNWNDQPSYSGYSVGGSDTVSGGQDYGSQVMDGAGSYGGVS